MLACGPRDLSSNPAWGKLAWTNYYHAVLQKNFYQRFECAALKRWSNYRTCLFCISTIACLRLPSYGWKQSDLRLILFCTNNIFPFSSNVILFNCAIMFCHLSMLTIFLSHHQCQQNFTSQQINQAYRILGAIHSLSYSIFKLTVYFQHYFRNKFSKTYSILNTNRMQAYRIFDTKAQCMLKYSVCGASHCTVLHSFLEMKYL